MVPKDIINIEEAEVLEVPSEVQSSSQGAITRLRAANLSSMPVTIYDSYKHKKFRLLREAKQRLKTSLFERDVWNVLWQVDGKRTVEDISKNLIIPLEEVIYHIESLRLIGIICSLDAVFLPDFIYEKTNKEDDSRSRRKEDLPDTIEDITEIGSE